jgi:hypothetical protein
MAPNAMNFQLMVCATLKSRAPSEANRQRAQQLAWRWISQKWPRLISGNMDLSDGRLERSYPGAQLTVVTADQGDRWMAEVTEVARDSRQWRTQLVVAKGVDADVLALHTGCSQTGSAPLSVAPPKLLAAWTEGLDVHDANERAAGEPLWVTDESHVARFVDLLLSGERALPVITLANKGSSRYYGVDPQALAKAMQGMAHVACVNQEARAPLAQRIGLALAPTPGAARIYAPGLRQHASSHDHPLVRQPPAADSSRPQGSDSFRQMIVRCVCAVSARGVACALPQRTPG